MARRASGWHQNLFRFALFVACIAFARVVIAFVSLTTSQGTATTSPLVRLGRELGLDIVPGLLPPPEGDDLRRGDLHEDVVFEGQVVRRDGKLVVLTDADDPDAEQFEALAVDDPSPGSAAVAMASVLGGACLFFAGLGVSQLVAARRPEPTDAEPAAPRPLVSDDRDDLRL